MDISGIYNETPIIETTDPATTAQTGWGLMWVEAKLEDLKPGMTVRFEDEMTTGETIVSTLRIENFSSVEEALVADAIYPNAQVGHVFNDFRKVSYLRLAY